MNPLIQLKQTTSAFLIAFGLTCFGLSPAARAVSPAPDGGYPNENTAEGHHALLSLDTSQGFDNTAIGFSALSSNTDGEGDTAIGASALLNDLTDGTDNTATGWRALTANTIGFDNTATGRDALFSNTTGTANTATGDRALHNNNGDFNTATGCDALLDNISGGGNTAIGTSALFANTTGNANTAVGNLAGADLTGSNNIVIGANVRGFAGESNTIRIGKSGTQTKTVIAGIRGATVASGVGVIVGTTGQIGTLVSSARFKEAIKPMDKASEAILGLRAVTFRYKEELDPDHIPQFGLIAEEVEKVNPELVARDEDGKIMSVRYEAVNAMLLNEFLKEHKAFLEEQRKVQELEANAAKRQEQIDALSAGLQKVSAQVEVSKAAPQTDLNQAEDFSPAGFFASSRPAIPENQLSGGEKGKQ